MRQGDTTEVRPQRSPVAVSNLLSPPSPEPQLHSLLTWSVYSPGLTISRIPSETLYSNPMWLDTPMPETTVDSGISAATLSQTVLTPERIWILERCRDAGSTSVGRLSEGLIAEMCDDSSSRQERRMQHVSLVHVHLPKLDGLGLVDYDEDAKTVRSTDTLDAYAEAIRLGRQFVDAVSSTETEP